MINTERAHLCKMLEVLSGAMVAAVQCNVTFKKDDAMIERFAFGALALLRDAGYTPEDLVKVWEANFGK